MKNLAAVLGILIAFSVHGQRNIFDGFDDNSNEWPTTIGIGDNSMNIAHGQYNVSSRGDGYWSATKTVTKGMDKHFRIEVSVKRDSGTADNKGVGIMWGNKGDSVRMTFLIFGDGHFIFQKIRGTQTQMIAPKDIQFGIDAVGYNNLRVERNMETNMYDFSINEQLVLSSPFVAPASDEVGLYADVAGDFHFDNFWFIEQANTNDSYRPHALSMADICGEEQLHYQSDYGYSFCVPFGWRVDEYKGTHCAVWPVGFPYQVNVDYAKLAIEDSFQVAARNDMKIFMDSAKFATKQKRDPLVRYPGTEGVEVWGGGMVYTDITDNTEYLLYRYYIYNEALGGFLLVETTTPVSDHQVAPMFLATAKIIAESMRWVAE